jgi:hypothetical protein
MNPSYPSAHPPPYVSLDFNAPLPGGLLPAEYIPSSVMNHPAFPALVPTPTNPAMKSPHQLGSGPMALQRSGLVGFNLPVPRQGDGTLNPQLGFPASAPLPVQFTQADGQGQQPAAPPIFLILPPGGLYGPGSVSPGSPNITNWISTPNPTILAAATAPQTEVAADPSPPIKAIPLLQLQREALSVDWGQYRQLTLDNICKENLGRGCRRGPQCMYLHLEDCWRPFPEQPCRDYSRQNLGQCHRIKCRYFHGPAQALSEAAAFLAASNIGVEQVFLLQPSGNWESTSHLLQHLFLLLQPKRRLEMGDANGS